jgi:hypothetical protein
MHISITAVFSFVIYSKLNCLAYVFIFVAGGILIDLDHFFDYFLFFKKRFKIKYFFTSAYLKSEKVYVPLHSWEIVLFVFLLGLVTHNTELFILSLSLTTHLLVDNIQRKNLLFYFFIYRLVKKFNARVLLPELTRS